MELNRYFIQDEEKELRQIEKDLSEYLNVPFVRCEYDVVNSHKYQDEKERTYLKQEITNAESTFMLDFIINYEKYNTKEDYDMHNGGFDGEVHELSYLIGGDGMYLVITSIYE